MPCLWNRQIDDVSTFISALKSPLASFQLKKLIRPGFLTTKELWSSWNITGRIKNAKYVEKDKPDWRPPDLCDHLKVYYKVNYDCSFQRQCYIQFCTNPIQIKRWYSKNWFKVKPSQPLPPLNQSFCFSYSNGLETNWISRYSLQSIQTS